MDNPNVSKDDCAADIESEMEPDNGIEDPESPEAVCACHTKHRQIDLANTEVKETGCTGVGDSLCNGNEEE